MTHKETIATKSVPSNSPSLEGFGSSLEFISHGYMYIEFGNAFQATRELQG